MVKQTNKYEGSVKQIRRQLEKDLRWGRVGHSWPDEKALSQEFDSKLSGDWEKDQHLWRFRAAIHGHGGSICLISRKTSSLLENYSGEYITYLTEMNISVPYHVEKEVFMPESRKRKNGVKIVYDKSFSFSLEVPLEANAYYFDSNLMERITHGVRNKKGKFFYRDLFGGFGGNDLNFAEYRFEFYKIGEDVPRLENCSPDLIKATWRHA